MASRNDDFAALRDFQIDNIRIGNQIGRGANGRILEAKWEGTVVAVVYNFRTGPNGPDRAYFFWAQF